MNSSISRLLWAMSQIARGQYEVTLHARKRMAERKVTHADIKSCAQTGSISPLEEGKFKVVGRDCDEDALTLVGAIEEKVILITVF